MPENGTLLGRYTAADSCFSDCYTVEINAPVTLSDFVYAFYTSRLFKVERAILRLIGAQPSKDESARRLADGSLERFSVWSVESRNDTQLLMCPQDMRTRSWFMVESCKKAEQTRTHLFLDPRFYQRTILQCIPSRHLELTATDAFCGFTISTQGRCSLQLGVNSRTNLSFRSAQAP